jgi:hypothetical protein
MNDMPNGPAPKGDRFRMGARGGATAKAWQYFWDRLDRSEFRDGTELARAAAEAFHLKDTSVISHLRLAVREGWLDTENRWVQVPVIWNGQQQMRRRIRTFYRVGHRAEIQE